MKRSFAFAAFIIQLLASGLVILMFGSNMLSSTRNPEAGLALVLVGIPLAALVLAAWGMVFVLREAFNQHSRGRITMASTATMLLTGFVILIAAMSS